MFSSPPSLLKSKFASYTIPIYRIKCHLVSKLNFLLLCELELLIASISITNPLNYISYASLLVHYRCLPLSSLHPSHILSNNTHTHHCLSATAAPPSLLSITILSFCLYLSLDIHLRLLPPSYPSAEASLMHCWSPLGLSSICSLSHCSCIILKRRNPSYL